MIGAPPKSKDHPDGVDPEEFRKYFIRHGRFTAGTSFRYGPSMITAAEDDIAPGFPVGMRFHSGQVTRVCDAKRVHLGHGHLADGRWRVYAFVGQTDPGNFAKQYLANGGIFAKFAGSADRINDLFDVRVVLDAHHHDVQIDALPRAFFPTIGQLNLTDHERVFAARSDDFENIYHTRGIDTARGAIVIVRPDQHVACVADPRDADTVLEFLTPIFG